MSEVSMKRIVINKRTAEIIGWSLLAVILIVAILYYNVFYTPVVENKVYAVGEKCPDFEVLQYESKAGPSGTFSSKEASGKVLIINFWYLDCTGCKEEMPEFNEAQEQYGDDIKIVVVHSYSNNTDDDKQAGINKLGYNDYLLTFVQDTEKLNLYTKLGGTYGYPMTVIVDRQGVIQYVLQRKIGYDALCAEIEKYL